MMARRVGRLVLCVTAIASATAAQDANYWHIAHGPVGQLVGGQVIASSRDLSATFYNPGALALGEKGAFLLSTESFQWESLAPPRRPRADCSTSRRAASAPRRRSSPGPWRAGWAGRRAWPGRS